MPFFESSIPSHEAPSHLPPEILAECERSLTDAAEARRFLEASVQQLAQEKNPSAGSRQLYQSLMEALERLYEDESVLRGYFVS